MKFLEYCNTIIESAWRCFGIGVTIFTILTAMSIVLICLSVSRRKLSQFVGGLIGLIVSIFALWVFGAFFPQLSCDDLVMFSSVALFSALCVAIFVVHGIFFED